MNPERSGDKWRNILVMLKREMDDHISDPNKLELPKSAWIEAVRRAEELKKEDVEKCEGCENEATTSDCEGVPLCAQCFKDLEDEYLESLKKNMDTPERSEGKGDKNG